MHKEAGKNSESNGTDLFSDNNEFWYEHTIRYVQIEHVRLEKARTFDPKFFTYQEKY